MHLLLSSFELGGLLAILWLAITGLAREIGRAFRRGGHR